MGYQQMKKSVKILKLVVNTCIGDEPQKLKEVAKKLVEFFKYEPLPTTAKLTVKKFNIRRGKKIGYCYKFIGKLALEYLKKIINTVPKKVVVKNGVLNWGVSEYSEIKNYRYNPLIANYGLTFHAQFVKAGYRISQRARDRRKFKNYPNEEEINEYLKNNLI